LPGLIAAAKTSRCAAGPARGVLVIYKGVEYSVTATNEPDVWQWQFRIGERLATGKTRTRLVHLATRRVQMRIDAALRASRAMQRNDARKS
jgi:hypothetical protein